MIMFIVNNNDDDDRVTTILKCSTNIHGQHHRRLPLEMKNWSERNYLLADICESNGIVDIYMARLKITIIYESRKSQ